MADTAAVGGSSQWEPSTWRSMTLDTLRGSEEPPRRRSGRDTNRVDDIDGATSFRREQRIRAKPDLFSTQDIDGAAPKRLVPDHAHPNFLGRNDDIDGSRPKPYTFRTSRCTNPNDPEYKLPTYTVRPITPPRFMRDAMSNDDIEGSKPRHKTRAEPRDPLKVDDIAGTTTSWRPHHLQRKGPSRNALDVSDIVNVGFKTQRVSDPLRPVHDIYGMRVEDDLRSWPSKQRQYAKPTLSLTTQDIEGAQADWRTQHMLGGALSRSRRLTRNPVDASDIPGAQPDTRKLCVSTKRHTNPVQPDYVALDGRRLATYTRPSTPHEEAVAAGDKAAQAQASTTAPAPGTAPSSAAMREKDEELVRLRAELQRMRASTDRRPTPATPAALPSRDPHAEAAAPASASARRRPISEAGMRVTQSRGSVFIASRTPDGGSAAERLVLRSSDGRPRIPLSPTERREVEQLVADIASVRSLPPPPARAGSAATAAAFALQQP